MVAGISLIHMARYWNTTVPFMVPAARKWQIARNAAIKATNTGHLKQLNQNLLLTRKRCPQWAVVVAGVAAASHN